MVNRQSQATVSIRNGRPVLSTRNTDLRSLRTKLLIQTAFMELAARRGFNAISVQDISRQALISRVTFYRYYKDKYYLAQEIFKSALRKLDASLGPLVILKQGDLARALAESRFQVAWTGLFEHFAANSRIYESLMGGKGSAWFLEGMRAELANFFRRIHRTRGGAVPAEAARCALAGGIVGLTYFWLKGGMKASPAKVASWFRIIAYKGYIAAIAGLSDRAEKLGLD